MIIDDKLLDSILAKASVSERLRMNHNLHDSLDAKAQRLLNALQKGTVLPIHRHRHTAETYILLKGRIDVVFYGDNGAEHSRYHLSPETGNHGVHIPAGQWHTIEVLDPSVIFVDNPAPNPPIPPQHQLYKPPSP